MGDFKGFHQDKIEMKHAAQTAATGNDPKAATGIAPSEEELIRGDYAKGKVSYMGLAINIENPVGSTRSGDGWSIDFTADYGEFNDFVGVDGDGIDVFIGDETESDQVWVVNQTEGGVLDEHKVILGCTSRGQAEALYYNHHDDDWPDQPVVETNIEDLRAWLILGDKCKAYPENDSWERKLISLKLRKNPELI